MDDRQFLHLWSQPKQREAAFEQLLRAENPALYRLVCRTVKDAELAEDLLQEIWMKVWDKLHLFRGESSLSTWLHRIAVNHCYDYLRKSKRRGYMEVLDDLPAHQQPAAGEELPDVKILELALDAALADLPTKQRLAFELRYFDELSYEAISEQLGTSVGGLKANYHLAVSKVKEKLMVLLNPSGH